MSRPGDDHDLDEDQVRRLLGELGDSLTPESTDPAMPADVTTRITDALAALPPLSPTATPPGDAPATVVPLRRRALPWLASAAAVVVIAGGGYTLLRSTAGNETSTASSATGAATHTQELRQSDSAAGRVALPALTTARFDAGVRRLLGTTAASSLKQLRSTTRSYGAQKAPAGAAPPATSDTMSAAQAPGTQPDCSRPAGVKGRQIAISLDKDLAQLIVHRNDGAQVVTAYDCAGTKRLASTTLR